jgi:hypothetical protein
MGETGRIGLRGLMGLIKKWGCGFLMDGMDEVFRISDFKAQI